MIGYEYPAGKVFEKGFTTNFTEEIFQISTIDQRQPPTMYTLKDHDGNIIEGRFYAEEMQKVDKPNLYAVERVIRRQKDGRHVVKFFDSPNLYVTEDVQPVEGYGEESQQRRGERRSHPLPLPPTNIKSKRNAAQNATTSLFPIKKKKKQPPTDPSIIIQPLEEEDNQTIEGGSHPIRREERQSLDSHPSPFYPTPPAVIKSKRTAAQKATESLFPSELVRKKRVRSTVASPSSSSFASQPTFTSQLSTHNGRSKRAAAQVAISSLYKQHHRHSQ